MHWPMAGPGVVGPRPRQPAPSDLASQTIQLHLWCFTFFPSISLMPQATCMSQNSWKKEKENHKCDGLQARNGRPGGHATGNQTYGRVEGINMHLPKEG